VGFETAIWWHVGVPSSSTTAAVGLTAAANHQQMTRADASGSLHATGTPDKQFRHDDELLQRNPKVGRALDIVNERSSEYRAFQFDYTQETR
jgi:hypothetical protein